jgi:hypothetical protein
MKKKLTFNKKNLPLATISPREANRVRAYLRFIGKSDLTADSLVSYLYDRRKKGIASKTLKADKSAIYLCLKLYCVTSPELRPLFDQIRIITNEAIKLRVSATRIRDSDLVTLEEMRLIQLQATDRAKTLITYSSGRQESDQVRYLRIKLRGLPSHRQGSNRNKDQWQARKNQVYSNSYLPIQRYTIFLQR